QGARPPRGHLMLVGILQHGFGQRYDLPIGLALYLFAAGGVGFISFVLIVLFAGDQVGAKALEYPRREVPCLLRIARSRWARPDGVVWPAVLASFAVACHGLTSGMASRPQMVAIAAMVYTAITLAGMLVFGRDQWLQHCEGFTVLFGIVSRFRPVEVERDERR